MFELNEEQKRVLAEIKELEERKAVHEAQRIALREYAKRQYAARRLKEKINNRYQYLITDGVFAPVVNWETQKQGPPEPLTFEGEIEQVMIYDTDWGQMSKKDDRGYLAGLSSFLADIGIGQKVKITFELLPPE